MSIEEIIKGLEAQAQHSEALSRAPGNKALSVAYMKRSVLFREAAAALLRTHPDAQPNEPLTLDELKEMAHQPVWVECQYFIGWAILHLAWPEIFVVAADGNTYFIWTNGEYNERLGAKLYRRPPKEEHHEETP